MRKNILTQKISVKLLLAIVISIIPSTICGSLFSSYVTFNYIIKANNIDPNIYNLIVLAIFGVFVVVFIVCFLLIINREVKYIKYITKQVKSIVDENFGSTLDIRGNDELAQLSRSINFMSVELKKKFEKERELDNTKTELITNVSHDLRTPLTAIIGYLDILKNEKYKTSEEAKEYLTSTYNLSEKLKRLIDELFEYTKLSSSDIVLDFIEADLGNILNQMLGEYAPIFESKGLKIIKHIDEDISVKVDIEKIVRVLDNILSNAEKYSIKPSKIIVRVTKKEDAALISIANKGERIRIEKLSKIFEKFYRVDTSRSNTIEGSGLGLAISKKIIELHNGEIWAECHGDMITISIKIPTI